MVVAQTRQHYSCEDRPSATIVYSKDAVRTRGGYRDTELQWPDLYHIKLHTRIRHNIKMYKLRGYSCMYIDCRRDVYCDGDVEITAI